MPALDSRPFYLRSLGSLIFFSRWLQAPLYLGLIVAQAVYVYKFFIQLTELVHNVWASAGLTFGGIPPNGHAPAFDETQVMLAVLGLIDVVMIANLLVMVIVGGYETFVSRLNLQDHPDQPEWLSHVNAGVLKVKLATALIGISAIHLLRSFIELGTNEQLSTGIVWLQIAIHMTFVFSAILLAVTDRISIQAANEAKGH